MLFFASATRLRVIFRLFCFFATFSCALLTGCGAGPANTSVTGALHLTGMVHGGQQGVVGSTIHLYRVGTAGNGSAATSLLATPVTTDNFGSFSLDSISGSTVTYDYTCANATDQVYIVATGGQAANATNNPALVMMDVLGNCGSLNSNSYITINEVTTAAAVWALAPFMTAYDHIGASATNASGLANAMLDAQLLASSSNGMAATLASNLTVEDGKLYGLADALAPCINSDGTSACTPLFIAAKPGGGSMPTDTFTAALDIVRNPGQNPGGVFDLISSTPPFPTTLTVAPNDWTITLAITGGGLNGPLSLGIDTLSNVWVANYSGALSAIGPQGALLSATGYGVGILKESYGLAIDTSNNIWVANEQSSPNANGSLSKFLGASSATPGAVVLGTGGGTNFYDSSLNYPIALAADNNGDIFIANYGGSAATVYNSSGTAIATNWGSADGALPTAIAADGLGGLYLANNSGNTVTHVDKNGIIVSNPSCCDGANGLATDAAGNVWIANYYGNSFSEDDKNGNIVIDGSSLSDTNLGGPGFNSYPAGVAVDAAQNVWVANFRGQSITELSGSLSTTPGALLSPAKGFGYKGPPSTPVVGQPYALLPDRSGNIWVSSYGNNNVVLFFGIATPTVTPLQSAPTAP